MSRASELHYEAFSSIYFLNAVNIEDHQYVFLGASKSQIRNTHIDPTIAPASKPQYPTDRTETPLPAIIPIQTIHNMPKTQSP